MIQSIPLVCLSDCANQDAVKAASIPISGAVVIAPLTVGAQNYGSVGGSLTAVGAPVISSTGAAFDGIDDALWIDSGASAEFTATFKLVSATPGDPTWLMTVMQNASGYPYGYGIFRYSGTSVTNWCIGAPEGTEVATSVPYTTIGVFTLRRAAGVLELYSGGSLVGSDTFNNPGAGSRLFLGARSDVYSPCLSKISNVALFNSALSAGNRAAVEAWAV